MPRPTEKLRIETKGEARARRERTLLGHFAACSACVPHLVRIANAWKPLFALLAKSGVSEAQPSNEAVTYDRVLTSVVKDVFGFVDKEGHVLDWAKNWAHHHTVHHDYANADLGFHLWGAYRPSYMINPDKSVRMPGLAIYVWQDSVHCCVAGCDDLEISELVDIQIDRGFGYNDLSKLKAQINKAAKAAIAYGEQQLRELPVQRGSMRPRTINREDRELGTLHYHLLTAEPIRLESASSKGAFRDTEPCGCPTDRARHGDIALTRAKKGRVSDLAQSLGIRCPRSPLC